MKFSDKELKSFYQSIKDEKITHSKLNESGENFDQISFEAIEKVAKNCEFTAFKSLINEGELPALKLSSAEMEALQGGGGLLYDIGYAVGKFVRDLFDSDQKSPMPESDCPPEC